jgi:hypothetical protein
MLLNDINVWNLYVCICVCFSDIPKKADRDLALTWALGTVIKDMGLAALVTNASVLDRTPNFVCKDKKYKLVRTNKKVRLIVCTLLLLLLFDWLSLVSEDIEHMCILLCAELVSV